METSSLLAGVTQPQAGHQLSPPPSPRAGLGRWAVGIVPLCAAAQLASSICVSSFTAECSSRGSRASLSERPAGSVGRVWVTLLLAEVWRGLAPGLELCSHLQCVLQIKTRRHLIPWIRSPFGKVPKARSLPLRPPQKWVLPSLCPLPFATL